MSHDADHEEREPEDSSSTIGELAFQSLILVGVPASAMMLVYAYHVGRCIFYGVPLSLITLDPWQSVGPGLLLGVSLMIVCGVVSFCINAVVDLASLRFLLNEERRIQLGCLSSLILIPVFFSVLTRHRDLRLFFAMLALAFISYGYMGLKPSEIWKRKLSTLTPDRLFRLAMLLLGFAQVAFWIGACFPWIELRKFVLADKPHLRLIDVYGERYIFEDTSSDQPAIRIHTADQLGDSAIILQIDPPQE